MKNTIEALLGFSCALDDWMKAYLSKQGRKGGLTIGQYRVLRMIRVDQPCSMSHLSAKLKVTPGSLTTMVNRLVREGLVSRMEGEKDRRVMIVSLCEKGESLLTGMEASLTELLGEMLFAAGCPSDRLVRALDDLSAVLESA